MKKLRIVQSNKEEYQAICYIVGRSNGGKVNSNYQVSDTEQLLKMLSDNSLAVSSQYDYKVGDTIILISRPLGYKALAEGRIVDIEENYLTLASTKLINGEYEVGVESLRGQSPKRYISFK